MHLGPAIVLTGKGYKEHHWLVIPPSTTSVTSPIHHYFYTMPSSFCTIPGSTNHLSISCAAVHIWGQTGHHTNQGWAITPFMYNEEEYHVSFLHLRCSMCIDNLSSMLVMRMGWNTLLLTISIIGPTPTIRMRTASMTFTVVISSMPSVRWLVVNCRGIVSIHTNCQDMIFLNFYFDQFHTHSLNTFPLCITDIFLVTLQFYHSRTERVYDWEC